MVVLLDALEKKGLIERQTVKGDRRAHAISMTKAGVHKLSELAKTMVRHERDFIAGLNPQEIAALKKLCSKFRAIHGLSNTVHPAYKKLGDKNTRK
jgi:DNA-binding MarR family transcriptional regulator